jgi:hypothetical protein
MIGRLKRWWQQLVGHPQSVDEKQSTTRPIPSGDPTRKPGKQATQRPGAPGELSIADDCPAKPKPRSGRAGFDPYSSDAGYSKPRGWDRLDHD